mmetsp:Transcript_21153/g.58820  ORF Transcript_21153/g.58820 Transcript_21153/m.58820 type:complete len:129 (-) Transcript_21153:626-1012(-)
MGFRRLISLRCVHFPGATSYQLLILNRCKSCDNEYTRPNGSCSLFSCTGSRGPLISSAEIVMYLCSVVMVHGSLLLFELISSFTPDGKMQSYCGGLAFQVLVSRLNICDRSLEKLRKYTVASITRKYG